VVGRVNDTRWIARPVTIANDPKHSQIGATDVEIRRAGHRPAMFARTLAARRRGLRSLLVVIGASHEQTVDRQPHHSSKRLTHRHSGCKQRHWRSHCHGTGPAWRQDRICLPRQSTRRSGTRVAASRIDLRVRRATTGAKPAARYPRQQRGREGATRRVETVEGFELQFSVNGLGHLR
jgi:hypothetical protein